MLSRILSATFSKAQKLSEKSSQKKGQIPFKNWQIVRGD
jgi:hypothetical protein